MFAETVPSCSSDLPVGVRKNSWKVADPTRVMRSRISICCVHQMYGMAPFLFTMFCSNGHDLCNIDFTRVVYILHCEKCVFMHVNVGCQCVNLFSLTIFLRWKCSTVRRTT